MRGELSPMPLARTTFQPSVVYNMDPREFDELNAGHLLYVDWRNLFVNFLTYSDGPPATVTGVTVQIKDAGNTVVVATTSTGVIPVGAGAYVYRWSASATPGSGTYSVLWSALDVDGITCTATDTVIV